MVHIVKIDGSYRIHSDDFEALQLRPEDDIRLECLTMYPDTFRLRVNGQDVPCAVVEQEAP